MKRKVKIILLLISVSICMGLMSSTYSRYVAGTTGDLSASFSKWQIFINTQDITSNTNSSISIDPTMETQTHVMNNTVAPSSVGYFDIDIDPTNVDVSFRYYVNLEMMNNDMPDLTITKFATFKTGTPSDEIVFESLSGQVISGNKLIESGVSSFKFEPFTIRVYFEWFEGAGEQMDDEADTAIGTEAADADLKFKVNANIAFEQIIG